MELRTYFLPLLRWWWLLLLASALAAVTSFWTVGQQPEQYQSTTTLMIGHAIQDPNPSGNQMFLGNQLAEAYADIAKRDPVRQGTMAALGMDWLPSYNVRALPNRQLIEIAVIDTNPARAQAVASELADQLVRLSPGGSQEGEQERQAFVTQQLDRLEEQITATEEEILAKQDELGELISAREIANTQNEIAALQSKLSSLQSTYAGLLAGTREEAVNTLSVIEPASFPSRPTGPGQEMTVFAATGIAFALAAGTAYLLEYLDDTVKSPKQASEQLGIPLIGTIARMQNKGDRGPLVMRDAPRSSEAEGFRGLRAAIQTVLASGNHNTFLITSPRQKDGKSLITANLAIAMAQAGQRVLLIDADLHLPSQHRLFSLNNTQGLSTLLQLQRLQPAYLEEASAESLHMRLIDESIIKEQVQERLFVITGGPAAPNPSELLVGVNISKLLRFFAPHYDVIILDTPPALALSDAAVLSNDVDVVFLLASVQKTRKADLESCLDQLESVKAKIGGIVLNQLPPTSEHYHYFYYSYSDYGTEAGRGAKDSAHSANGDRSNGFLRRIRELRSIVGKGAGHGSVNDS